jgi:hypothetical protein
MKAKAHGPLVLILHVKRRRPELCYRIVQQPLPATLAARRWMKEQHLHFFIRHGDKASDPTLLRTAFSPLKRYPSTRTLGKGLKDTRGLPGLFEGPLGRRSIFQYGPGEFVDLVVIAQQKQALGVKLAE